MPRVLSVPETGTIPVAFNTSYPHSAIQIDLGVNQIVPHHVGSRARHALAQAAVDQCRGQRRGPSADPLYGKPQVGVEFHRSVTLGLLLALKP